MVGFTLARYLSTRFLSTVMGVFGTMFALIYLIDFVELFRRSGDTKGATAQLVALLSLLRVPAVAEQMLPFAVLFGAMFAFLNLTRKLELIVARAAGVSVWQFLLPPVAVALALGLFAVTVYNPMSAIFKQRADRLEVKLFGQKGGTGDADLWIRQKSLDGQAILRATRASDGGINLSGVTAFVFEPDGSFMERIESDHVALHPGYWSMENARVLAPDTAPVDDHTYLLASNLTPEQVTQSFVPPESVPFWELPEVRDRTERAGLDATAYALQYQKLLARPLLFVAMVLVAASFSLRFFRFGGVARMVAGGVASGFVLYVATKLVGDLGGAGLLSTQVAAWSPAIVGSMLGSLVLLYQEDG
ncbi:LPS export ABC transporter permease LptG [Lichenihabitans sp. Uapishka_5]|uniref:LPS export ABC transporter permease LptG n=1 Tax=Lichenihabitans sp. Uapishka_5 TaxID=3037302 RepID=UPI0029E823D9|nr:LPS export ABC transporter permease LptG [Lichenihabitans sp. Uapishka_5]MDX7950934.1 LPS export ABC transporter permease LptG [Lichenihabitans sp. Uapishka_5]